MKYLLDTNVISETIRKSPNVYVHQWFQTIPSAQLFISVLTLGEIRRGIAKLQDNSRKDFLTTWLENDLAKWFGKNIMSVTLEVADKWGVITSSGNLPAIDALLAATALTYNMKLVTRNTTDFDVAGLELINPWNFYI